MNTAFALETVGLEELDGAAMLVVHGGLGGWQELLYDAGKALLACILSSSDSLIDGVQEGWAAAS